MFDFVKKNIKKTEIQIDEELTTVINNFETNEEARRPKTTVTTSTDRTEFTTLLNELLDEATEPSAPSIVKSPPKKEVWASPSLTAPSTTSTASPSPKITRTSSASTSTYTHSVVIRPYTESSRVKSAQTTTSTAEPVTTTSITEKGADYDVYEDGKEDIYDDEKPENVSVEVVPIQTMGNDYGSKTKATESPQLSTRSRLFSDDSWEQPPPNFGYSSMRYPNGGVTPLNIDTSTLFGIDDDGKGEEDGEEADEEETKTSPIVASKKESPKKVDVRKAEDVVKAAVRLVRPTMEPQRGPIYVTQRITMITTSSTKVAPSTER
ncbi:unnamed protein product [Strongylus vulgaris]|uniref:Uncharacterized protein n=1 Tax=Strongylus vulgaris TaxID=40348 RepID=A0A3P7IQP3_STRVU|nr:unnamed protein product [Strongylus vulgaris]